MSAHIFTLTDAFWSILLLFSAVLFVKWLANFGGLLPPKTRSISIIVLGDIGRSPRTTNHAESFARAGFNTFIVGYKGTAPPPSLLTAPGIRFVYLPPPPKVPERLFFIFGPLKAIHQCISLIYGIIKGLYLHRPPQFVMVQNPPSVPTLVFVQIAAWLRGTKVIIDWHNLGYSILGLKLGHNHPLVIIYELLERTFGRSAYAHLFVSDAMRQHLEKEWGLKGHKVVFHDRPPLRFHPTSATEAHELFLRIPPFNPPMNNFLQKYSIPSSTFRTQISNSSPSQSRFSVVSDVLSTPLPEFRADRPALAVTSTSWTADEDFGLLIDALRKYEKLAKERELGGRSLDRVKPLPKLVMVVTGKGPLQKTYMERVLRLEEEENWQWVRCRSMWLEAADYPLLLGAADIGVSLHSSSSGLDLPMKVVDMFGCGLPVCALDFPCLKELVVDGRNGLVFKDADQLAMQFKRLLEGFPLTPELDRLRSSLRQTERMYHNSPAASANIEGWCSWETNWEEKVRPLVDPDVSRDERNSR